MSSANLKVVIPLKTNSERIKNKNLRPFFGEDSLFDIKAKQLLKTFEPNDVYCSSENIEAKQLVEKYGFNFLLRDNELTKKTTKENLLVKSIVEQIPGKPDILWCQVTQPLFNDFDNLIRTYKSLKPEYDSICVVKRFRHHLLNEQGCPLNFQFGYWHKISQDLPKLYEVAWAAFIMKRDYLENAWYQIGRNPYLFETNQMLIDIDEIEDFELASMIYEKKHAFDRLK